MIRAVIFDMDGVLVDSEPLQYEAYHTVLADFGVELSRREFSREWIGQGGLRRNLERHGIAEHLDEVRRAKGELYARLTRERMQLRPGARELLQRLAPELPLALASSAHPDSVLVVLDRFWLRPFFRIILTGADVARNKPDPEIYLLAAERLGLPPAECLVFEDSAPGVTAAKAAGMTVFAFPHPFTADQDLSAADRIISDLGTLDPRLISGEKGVR